MNVQKCNICVLFQQLVTSGVSYYRHSAVAQMVILLSATISLEHLTKLFIYCVADSDGLFFLCSFSSLKLLSDMIDSFQVSPSIFPQYW